MKPGTRVRMSEGHKLALRGKCGRAGRHVGPFDPGEGDDPGGDCWGCSSAHVDEFGSCVGIVEGHMKGPNGEEWPEVDVRWLPSGLRYGYKPSELVIVF